MPPEPTPLLARLTPPGGWIPWLGATAFVAVMVAATVLAIALG